MSYPTDGHFKPPMSHFGTDPTWSHTAASLHRPQNTVLLTPGQVSLHMRQQPVHALATADGKEKTRKPVDPPPILQIEVEDRADPNRHHLFSPHLFVLASLVPEGSDIATSHSQKGIIGETCSAIHRLKDRDGKEGGYFVFGDISVRKPGRYRLQFSLFNNEPPGKYVFLAETFSEFFTVYSSKDFQGMEESTQMSRSFNEQGVRLRMRKETRSRQSMPGMHSMPSYHQSEGDDRQHQHYSPDVYQQLPVTRNYASQPAYAMDDRGMKRRREDDHEARIPPPAQTPRTTYYSTQYPTTSYAGLNLSSQSYAMPTHPQLLPPAIPQQPALSQHHYFGQLGGQLGDINPELFKQ